MDNGIIRSLTPPGVPITNVKMTKFYPPGGEKNLLGVMLLKIASQFQTQGRASNADGCCGFLNSLILQMHLSLCKIRHPFSATCICNRSVKKKI